MLKRKYLHRKSRRANWSTDWDVKKFKRGNDLDLFSDLPFHQSIRGKYSRRYSNYDLTPLYKFIESKIGQNWNNIFSEIVKKVKPKFKKDIFTSMRSYRYYHFCSVMLYPIYDNDFIPRNEYGRILSDFLFVENGILVKKSEQQIISDAKKYKQQLERKEKLNNIFANKDVDFEEIQNKYNEYFIKDGEERMKKYRRN